MIKKDETVYYPFGKVVINASLIKYWILYNAKTGKFEAFTARAIVEERGDGVDIRGFNSRDYTQIRPVQSFKDVLEVGVDQEKETKLAFKRVYTTRSKYFLETVDFQGCRKMMSQEQAVEFINNGNTLLGARLRNGKLFVSQELLISFPAQGGFIHQAEEEIKRKPVFDVMAVQDEDE